MTLANLDETIFRALYQGETDAPLSALMVVLSTVGSGWSGLALAPLLALPRTRLFAAGLSMAVLCQGVVVFVVKHLVQRVRPWSALDLHPIFGVPTDYSFPSGHAAGSFSVAGFMVAVALARGLPRARWRGAAALVALTLASGIALSRIYLGAHYPVDVLAGALLGSSIGAGFGRWYIGRVRRRPVAKPCTSSTENDGAGGAREPSARL